MTILRWANIIAALLAVPMPLAHVLELPNKFALNGPLWLTVQQHLYRGWGPVLGGPAEITGLLTSLLLFLLKRGNAPMRRLMTIASLAYASMLAVFFLLNRPVNESVSLWTAQTLPSNWTIYRLRWEVGHGLAFVLSLIGLAAVVRAHFIRFTIASASR
jgi:hypothetical protein